MTNPKMIRDIAEWWPELEPWAKDELSDDPEGQLSVRMVHELVRVRGYGPSIVEWVGVPNSQTIQLQPEEVAWIQRHNLRS